MQGFPVLHSQFAQTYVYWVNDVMQPFHPVTPFFSCSQSFLASGSFPMTKLFESSGQSIEISVSASVLPMNIQGWFLLVLTPVISLLFKGLSRDFSRTTVGKLLFFGSQTSLWSNFHIHNIALTRWIFIQQMISLLFNRLSRFILPFLPRSKHLLISRLQSSSAVILEPKKIVCHCLHCLSIYLTWNNGIRCYDLLFLNVKF